MATRVIHKDEVVAVFDGSIYEAGQCTDLPSQDIANHAIQIGENTWQDSVSLARFINHSCNPNCGIIHRTSIAAMRTIQPGEELCFDYDMTEDSNWRMECLCGAKDCRHIIGAFEYLPPSFREKYRGYISQWLVDKYGL